MVVRAGVLGGLALVVAMGCGGRSVQPADTDVAGTAGLDAGGTVGASGGSTGNGGQAGSMGATSSAGAPAASGAGGTNLLPLCVPGQTVACACPEGGQGVQTCADGGYYEACVCTEGTLSWFRSKLPGRWAGTRTTPWDTQPLPVTLELNVDGSWSGFCGVDCPMFYYGSPTETSENRYSLNRTNEDRVAFGRLSITWEVGSSTEGDLRNVRFEAEETKLFFDFWATWNGEYGPISFVLERQ